MFDEKRRQVYFTANGRERGEDPYQRHLYVSNLDGTGLRLLTAENADHDIEKVGEKLRAMMPWIKEKALVDKAKN